MGDTELWKQGLAECGTIESFNHLAVATARDQRKTNPEFARLVVAEAQRRKYTWMGDKDSGWYVDVTPEERLAIKARMEALDRKEQRGRMTKLLSKTKVDLVSAAWEVWVYGGSVDVGAMLIMDYRKRKDNRFIYEFDEVPKDLYFRLFTKDAKMTLTNIYRMFAHQTEPILRNWKEAI